ncbi:hypothetical protein [Streptomyces sp. CoH17]|uniref:hypothetical protein n=1 Tax=Streptomyces sp. CoH17 TaxID=2992806 RepID=UPI00226E1105|nr:hypothetical protein [Streptomyces sp. CoH17]
MAIDFSRYNAPGVLTEAIPGPQVGVNSTAPNAVGIFGDTVRYKTDLESVTIPADVYSNQLNTPTLNTPTTSTTGGQLSAGIYTYRLTALDDNGETLASAEKSVTVPAGTSTNTVTVTWPSVSGATGGYKIYGRTLGNELFIASVASGTLTYTDTGAISPSGNLPLINTTGTAAPVPSQPLRQLGINPDTILVTNPLTNTTYVLGTDYTVVRSPGADGILNNSDDNFQIQRIVGGSMSVGTLIQTGYQYTDPTFFDVYNFYDYSDVVDAYGHPFDSNGNIISELTLACRFAFLNGARRIVACAVEHLGVGAPTIQEYSEALDKLANEEEIAVVVPATGQQGVFSYVSAHVTRQSSMENERRAIMGFDGSVNPVNSTSRISVAGSIDNERVALVSPATMMYLNEITNSEQTIGGQYVAAALAGITVAQSASLPLTRKQLTGFLRVGESVPNAQKDLEAQGGLMVIETTRLGVTRVRHGLTTNPTNILTKEWSIIGQQDAMAFRLRDYLDQDNLIGGRVNELTLTNIKASAASALQSLIDDETIVAYQNLAVRQLVNTPDVIEIRYDWQAAVPLNYIVVRYSVNISTGQTTITTAS